MKEINNGQLFNIVGRGFIIACQSEKVDDYSIDDEVTFKNIDYIIKGIETTTPFRGYLGLRVTLK